MNKQSRNMKQRKLKESIVERTAGSMKTNLPAMGAEDERALTELLIAESVIERLGGEPAARFRASEKQGARR